MCLNHVMCWLLIDHAIQSLPFLGVLGSTVYTVHIRSDTVHLHQQQYRNFGSFCSWARKGWSTLSKSPIYNIYIIFILSTKKKGRKRKWKMKEMLIIHRCLFLEKLWRNSIEVSSCYIGLFILNRSFCDMYGFCSFYPKFVSKILGEY